MIYVSHETHLLHDILEKYSKVFDSEQGKMKNLLVKIPYLLRLNLYFIKLSLYHMLLRKKLRMNQKVWFRRVYLNLYHIQSGLQLFYQFKNLMGLWGPAGDYKAAVNKVTQCDKYPVPRTKELLVSLNGGERLGFQNQMLVMVMLISNWFWTRALNNISL